MAGGVQVGFYRPGVGRISPPRGGNCGGNGAESDKTKTAQRVLQAKGFGRFSTHCHLL